MEYQFCFYAEQVDILGQLRENPDILPVVYSSLCLHPDVLGSGPILFRPTGGSSDESLKSPPDAASPIAVAAATVAAHLHSPSASLNGGDVCPAPSDSAVSAAICCFSKRNPILLAPRRISNNNNNNPVVAVTIDGATLPVVAIPALQFPTTAASQTISRRKHRGSDWTCWSAKGIFLFLFFYCFVFV